jgi:C4-dicarboxylate-specific signal transduction histidine kinase
MSNVSLEQKKSDLEALFYKFNEASTKLEEKYAQLLNETEELRRQLQIKTEEAQRCERLAALGETAAAIAHEIRNPLGAIKLFVSLLRTEIQGSVAGREYIDLL